MRKPVGKKVRKSVILSDFHSVSVSELVANMRVDKVANMETDMVADTISQF